MRSIADILNRPAKPFDVEDYGGLREDEYILDEVIYCKKCNTPRLFVLQDTSFKARCMCKCQAEEHERKEQEWKEIEKQREIEKFKRASLMGDRYKDVTFATTETMHNATFAKAYIRCQKYCKVANEVLEKGYGLYIYGDKGTGKTHLTACMANELMQQRKQVLFTNFFEISKEIRSTFGKAKGTEQEYINRFASVDFLFLDDLGTERVQAQGNDLWLQEKIFDVLNKRYNNRKPTIFTSNHSLNELVTERGIMDKTVDRITEMSSVVLKIEGESYRMKARASADLPF